MNKLKNKLLILISLIFILNVNAASVSIECPSSAYLGDTFKCTIAANNEGGLGGGIEGTINYSGLIYDSVKNISDSNYFMPTKNDFKGAFDMTSASSKLLAEYSFKSETEGKVTINVDCNKLTNYEFETLECSGASAVISIIKEEKKTEEENNNNNSQEQKSPEINNNNNNVDISQKSNKQTNIINNNKSSNIGLKKLEVEGYNVILDENGTYKLTVAKDVKKITINAIANNSKASIKGTGEKLLFDGENTFKIIVTAEDGTLKEYTLVVNREIDKEDYSNQTNESIRVIESTSEDGNTNILLYVLFSLGIIGLIVIIILLVKKKTKKNKRSSK